MKVITEKRIARKTDTSVKISEVLKNNLFTLAENEWVYTDDNKREAMTVTYKIDGDEIVFDIWMIDDNMHVLLNKIIAEIEN